MDYRVFQSTDFALINPLQVDVSEWKNLEHLTIVPTAMADQAHLFPLLIEIRALEALDQMRLHDKSERFLQDNDYPLFSALFETEWSPRALKEHLCRCLVQRTGTHQQYLLRVHDPRVFRHMSWLLTPKQMHVLMGAIRTWRWQDAITGEWKHYQHPDGVTHAHSGAQLFLSNTQWDSMHRMELLNVMLHDMGDKAISEVKIQAIDQALGRAINEQKLKSEADVILYVQHTLLYGDKLFLQPRFRDVLHAVRQGDITYVQACADLSPDDYSPVPQDAVYTPRT